MSITSPTNPDTGIWVYGWMTEWGFIPYTTDKKAIRQVNKMLSGKASP